MSKVILITGGSSGIGYEAAGRLARKGHKVYAAARRVERLDGLKELGVKALKLDVTDEESARACVQAVLDSEGRIDVLVNNAGYGYLGPVESVPMDEARKQMETNLFGAALLSKLVIPDMRARGSGRIINISSLAGQVPVLFGGWYNISKYAIEALSDTMRIELRRYGIDVVKIEPGGIKTAWGGIAADHLEECTRDTVYEGTAAKEAKLFRTGYSSNIMTPPSSAARAIERAACSRRPRVRYRPGIGASSMAVLHSLIPPRWWDSLVRLMGKF